MPFHVDSEVGQLHQVILHRPGLELTRLTPQNVDDLLFDDVMWAQRAREEHDAFAEKLRAKGVKVYLFHDLLAQAIDQPGAREFLQEELTTATRFGPALDAPLDELVGQQAGRPAGGGARRRRPQARPRPAEDLQPAAGVPGRRRLPAAAAAQPPVPAGQLRLGLRRPVGQPDEQAGPQAGDDQLAAGLELPPDVPGRPAALLLRQRQREPRPGQLRGRRHPRHRQRRGHGRHGGADQPQGIEFLARQYFRHGKVTKVIAVELPKTRSFMHLDTAMTMIDRDAFSVYPHLPETLRSFTLTPVGTGGDYQVTENAELFPVVADALGVEKVRVMRTPIDLLGAQREQWDDGNNFLAIAPRGDLRLRAQHHDQHVPAPERHRDRDDRRRGARPRPRRPRCMSCPIERDAVDAAVA